jgi:hypothetical protein
VPRAPRSRACLVVLLATTALSGTARAQSNTPVGGIHDLMLPVGLHPVLADNPGSAAPDRSHFLVDFIRRTYNRPLNRTNLDLDAALRPLLAGDNGSNGPSTTRPDTLPLPLSASTWIETVFGGRETPHTLLAAILRSRGASLFYYGLLSLDDETRAWLVTEPRLIAEMSGRRAAAFVAAAPGLRVRGSRMEFPGGDAALPVWESLVGHRAADPEGFTRALLAKQDGRLAYFLGAMSQLTPGQLRVALRLDSPDTGARVGAGRQLLSVFGRVVLDWRVDENVFWRPELDPALLVASLHRGSDGLPIVPGTRHFWAAVFADQKRGWPTSGGTASLALPGAEAVDFPWLCEQVFTGNREADRRRYQVVLFVSRLEARGARWIGPNAIVAAGAAHSFPALIFSLERAKLVDVGAFAAAARRAEKLSAIRDEGRATRALAQFQGALALVTRAGSRGGIPPAAMASAISSLSTVEFTQPGDYEGRLVRWVTGWLAAHVRAAPALELDVPTAGAVERNALATLAGPAAVAPRFVDWEGTRYRLDFAAAEANRIAKILGEQPRPYLSSAAALVAIADALGRDGANAEQVRQHADALGNIALDVGWEHDGVWEGTDVRRRYLDAATALQGAAAAPDTRTARVTGAALLTLADDLLARGLMELAYAVALGQPDRPTITADEAARRHDFARPVAGRQALAWEIPSTGMSPGRAWHLAGSVLGLDVRLAHLALAPVFEAARSEAHAGRRAPARAD